MLLGGTIIFARPHIVVVGSGPLALRVAERAAWEIRRSDVVLINPDLGPPVPGDRADYEVVRGHPAAAATLEAAHVEARSHLLVLTERDELNFVVAHVARMNLGVASVLARADDLTREALFRDLGIASLNPVDLAASAVLAHVRR